MRRILLALALLAALPGRAALAPPPLAPSVGTPTQSAFRDGMSQARRSPERAAELIDQAASLGNSDAQFFLAASHLRQDTAAAAAPWVARAAQQGHVEAMSRLARMLEAGDGVRHERAFAAV